MTNRTSRLAAHADLVDHRFYKYRGCAPDPDQQGMALAGGLGGVPLDVWGPYTDDGAEPQKVRLDRERLAKAVCARCPVLAACRVYANTTVVDEDGVEHLVEPEGVMGGELALTRHRALIARRHAATTESLTDTPAAEPKPAAGNPGTTARGLAEDLSDQKKALLKALARETDSEAVAYRAGMDVRTANWQRSYLVTLLGLDKEHATRDQLLAAAVDQGLLPKSARIRPDGRWPVAAAPTTDGVRQRRIAPGRPVQPALPGMEDMPRHPRTLAGPPVPDPVPVRRPRPVVVVQLPLFTLTAPATRTVPPLAPARGTAPAALLPVLETAS